MNDLDDEEALINEGYFEDYARDMAEDAYGVEQTSGRLVA